MDWILMQRYRLLKKIPPFNAEEYESVALEREEMYRLAIGKGNWEQRLREGSISLSVNLAVVQHLGIFEVDCLLERLNTGVERSIEYFLGDWWKCNELDISYLDKSHPDRSLIWSSPYSNAAFLCGLTGRWDDLQRISDWVDESVYPEITFGAIEDEFMVYLIYVASCLRHQRLSTHDRMFGRAAWAKAGWDYIESGVFTPPSDYCLPNVTPNTTDIFPRNNMSIQIGPFFVQ